MKKETQAMIVILKKKKKVKNSHCCCSVALDVSAAEVFDVRTNLARVLVLESRGEDREYPNNFALAMVERLFGGYR